MTRWLSRLILVGLLVSGGLAVRSLAVAEDAGTVAGVEARQLVDDGALLLDVRTPQEFASGHIEGALNIPIDELSTRLDELGSHERPIVVYCRSGSRSRHAAELLERQGFEDVYDLGSFRNW